MKEWMFIPDSIVRTKRSVLALLSLAIVSAASFNKYFVHARENSLPAVATSTAFM
jgi:hypothetical protein